MEENWNMDDDCWVHIFRLLPLWKRIQLEILCSKWKHLMPYSDVNSIHLAMVIWPQDRLKGKQDERGSMSIDELHHILSMVLSRCGHYLRHLDLSNASPPFFRCALNRDLADLLVEKAPRLVTLDLTECVLNWSCFPALARLNKLEELLLDGVFCTRDDGFSSRDNRVNKIALRTIQNLPTLKKLHLGNVGLAPAICNASLRDLKMNGGTLTVTVVENLVQHCPNLESLDIDIFNELDLQLGALGGLHNLKNLALRYGILHSEGLAKICIGCPNLERLSLDVECLTSCADLWRLSNLKSLCISNGALVDDAVFASVAIYGLLEKVCLPRAELTNDGLHSLTHCPNLVQLDLYGISSITDEGIMLVLEKCKKLEQFDANGSSIGDEAMAAIGTNGISLTHMWATQRTKVTENGLRGLVEERGERLKGGEVLVPLQVWVSCQCPIAKELLDAINLTVL